MRFTVTTPLQKSPIFPVVSAEFLPPCGGVVHARTCLARRMGTFGHQSPNLHVATLLAAQKRNWVFPTAQQQCCSCRGPEDTHMSPATLNHDVMSPACKPISPAWFTPSAPVLAEDTDTATSFHRGRLPRPHLQPSAHHQALLSPVLNLYETRTGQTSIKLDQDVRPVCRI